MKAGAVGYLLKNVSVTQMMKQIRSIEQGEAALMPGMTRKILNEFARQSDTRPQGPAELRDESEIVVRLQLHRAGGVPVALLAL